LLVRTGGRWPKAQNFKISLGQVLSIGPLDPKLKLGISIGPGGQKIRLGPILYCLCFIFAYLSLFAYLSFN